IDHVVAESPRTERAAVADSVLQDPPRIAQLVTILPCDLQHLDERPWARMAAGADRQHVAKAKAAAARVEGSGAHAWRRLTVAASHAKTRRREAVRRGRPPSAPPRRSSLSAADHRPRCAGRTRST